MRESIGQGKGIHAKSLGESMKLDLPAVFVFAGVAG